MPFPLLLFETDGNVWEWGEECGKRQDELATFSLYAMTSYTTRSKYLVPSPTAGCAGGWSTPPSTGQAAPE